MRLILPLALQPLLRAGVLGCGVTQPQPWRGQSPVAVCPHLPGRESFAPPPAVGTACFAPRGWRPQCPGVRVHRVTLLPPGPEPGPSPSGLRALPSPWGVSGSPQLPACWTTPSVESSLFPLRAQALPGGEGDGCRRQDTAITSH